MLRNVLVTWARITMEERHVPPPTEDTIPALVAYLTYHSEWIGRHPVGDEAEEEIADAIANLERLTDQPSSSVFAGRCPMCGSAVYGKEGRPTAVCTTKVPKLTDFEACGTIVDVSEGRAQLLARRPRACFASATDIPAILPVEAATVRKWGSRGHLGGYCDVVTKEGSWFIESVMERIEDAERHAA